MNIKLNYLIAFFVLFLFASNDAFAQDKIYKKNKSEPILAKVVEIGTGEIKYKLWEEQAEGLIYVVEKTTISHIEFENGRTEYYGREKMDMEEYFEGQKKRAFKVAFLGPLVGVTSFTYEQNIRPGRSWEARGSIVGLGFNDVDGDNSKGFVGSFAYKLYRKPTFVTSDLRRRHILQGAYIKPEIFFGSVTRDELRFNQNGLGVTDVRETKITGGLILNFGKQWVFGDVVPLDVSIGIGYGAGEISSPYIVSDAGFAFGSGLNIGIAF